ncbi:MAG: hypothetical protein EOO48_03620 [Flavobacterium sp.]|nr:MAG: hypothetical protein EOO48_03620 [Flavobacterium sp.]
MIYILIALIALLTAVIVGLCINFSKAKRSHAQKVGELQYVIVQLTAHNDEQIDKLKLSDALREKLQTARETIDKDLISMQYDFVETLAKNNLIK